MEITNLNYDVLLNILSFMDDKSKLLFVSTCKKYRHLLNNIEFNESYYLENIKHLNYLNSFTNIIIKLHVDFKKFNENIYTRDFDIDIQFTKLFTNIDCDLLPNKLKILYVERNEYSTVKLTRNTINLTKKNKYVDNVKNTPKIRAKRNNNNKGFIPFIYSLYPCNEVKINEYLYTIEILYPGNYIINARDLIIYKID